MNYCIKRSSKKIHSNDSSEESEVPIGGLHPSLATTGSCACGWNVKASMPARASYPFTVNRCGASQANMEISAHQLSGKTYFSLTVKQGLPSTWLRTGCSVGTDYQRQVHHPPQSTQTMAGVYWYQRPGYWNCEDYCQYRIEYLVATEESHRAA